MKRGAVLLLLILAVFYACNPEPSQPNWEVQALTPLAKTRIQIDDIWPDTSVAVSNDSSLILIYRRRIASLSPDEVARPFNRVSERSVGLKTIDLGKRVIRNDISLGRIADQAGFVGTVIKQNHGGPAVVPSINGVGPTTFPVDATELFQSMTLKDGWMVLRMQNQLKIPLSNLQYEIRNQSGGTPILQNNLATLPVGAVHYDSVRLNNNVTIEGQLQATLQNLDSPGSNGDTITIDTNDVIDLSVTIDQLEPVQATAIFPTQNLVNDTSASSLTAPSARLTRVHVVRGDIFLDATSTIEDSVTVEYTFPGAVRRNEVLNFREVLPPAPPGSQVLANREVPVADFDIDLTGLPDSAAFNTFYTVLEGRVDSSGRLITLSLNDSVFLSTGIDNLEADRGYGFMGYDTIDARQSAAFEPFRSVQSGRLALDSVNLEMEVENYLGVDLEMRVNSAEAVKNEMRKSLIWDSLGTLLPLKRATENTPGARPVPGRTRYQLTKSNSNIGDLISILPDSMEVDLTTFMNRGTSPNDLSQFLYVNYGVDAFLNLEVPLNYGMDQVRIVDTTSLDFEKLDPDKLLQSGELVILAENFFPFAATVDLIFLDERDRELHRIEGTERMEPAKTDANNRAIQATQSRLKYPLVASAIPELQKTKEVVFAVEFQTDNFPQRVRIFSDNYLKVNLVGDLNILTQ